MSLLPPLPQQPPNDVLLPVLLRDLLAPGVVAGWILFRCAARRRRWLSAVGSVVAIIAAVVVGNWRREIFPWAPEDQTWQWLPIVGAIVLLVGLLAHIPQIPWPDRLACCAVASLWSAWMLTPLDLEKESAGPLSATMVVWLFAAVIFVDWLVLDLVAKVVPGGAVALGLAILLMATSIIVLYGSARFSDIALILAASFAGISLAAWLYRVDVGATAPCGIVFVGGLLFAGNYYDMDNRIPLTSYLLLALAPLGPLLLTPFLFLSATRRRNIVVQVLLVVLFLAPAITAVLLAVRRAEAWPF